MPEATDADAELPVPKERDERVVVENENVRDGEVERVAVQVLEQEEAQNIG